MGKRRAEELEDGDAAAKASMDERKLAFATHLRALNQQFASWVQAQSIDTLWADAARDYVAHADKLSRDFADVLGEASAAERADAGGNGGAFGLFSSGGPADDEPSTSPTKRAATVAAVAAASAPSPGPGGGTTVNGFSFGAPPADAAAAAGASPMTAGLFGAAKTAAAAGAGGEGFGGGFGGFGASAAAAKPADEAAAAKPPGGFSFGAPTSTTTEAPPPAAAAKPAAFTFGAPAEPDDGDEPAAAAPAAPAGGLFSFGAPAAAADKEAAEKPAPAAAAAGGSLFSFGNAAAAAAGPPAPSLFNFGGPGAASGGGAGAGAAPAPFSFGAPPAPFGGAAAAATQAGGDGGGADDDDEGPRKFAPEVQLDSEAYEVLFSAKAKFMVQVKDPDGKGPLTWDPRGLGLLSLRRPRDGKRTPIIMFTTDAGRSLLASPLSASTNPIVPQNQPKRVLVSVLLADAPPKEGGEGGEAAAKTYSLRAALFQMGAPEKVSEFKEAVLKGRPAA